MPATSPSPGAACPSPIDRSAPGALTGRYNVKPGRTSGASMSRQFGGDDGAPRFTAGGRDVGGHGPMPVCPTPQCSTCRFKHRRAKCSRSRSDAVRSCSSARGESPMPATVRAGGSDTGRILRHPVGSFVHEISPAAQPVPKVVPDTPPASLASLSLLAGSTCSGRRGGPDGPPAGPSPVVQQAFASLGRRHPSLRTASLRFARDR